jgi:hypothetical protein
MTKWISLAFRILAAIVLGQTLFYKFTGAPESVFIFQTMGMEPFGRIGSGILELLTIVFLLVPRTSWLGGILGAAMMLGAILAHVFVLGIAVMGDHGLLFNLAVFTFLACAIVVILERKRIPFQST